MSQLTPDYLLDAFHTLEELLGVDAEDEPERWMHLLELVRWELGLAQAQFEGFAAEIR